MTRIVGISGNLADVDDDDRLKVKAVSSTDIEFASEDKGKAFSWSSSYAATGGDEVLYIKNTSQTEKLIISEVIIAASAACTFTLFEVSSGTAAGTVVTGQNLNLGSGNSASASAFGNASVTGTLTGNALSFGSVPASSGITLDLKSSLVLGQNNEIAITASATSTVYVTVLGYFD